MAFRGGGGGGRCEKSHSWRSYKALPPSAVPTATYSDYTSDYTESRTYESCKHWIKYAIYACNIVFLVVGVTILSVGAWLRTDSRFREFLSERYRNIAEADFWAAPTLYIFSYIMIVLGCCMVVVSVLGCCGAVTQSKVLLLIYSVVIATLMAATLAAGIYILYKRDGIGVEVENALIYMVQHYYQGAGIVQESLDRLQQTFRCCGNGGCGDFRIFRQDPPRSCDIRCDGCHYRIMISLRIGFSVAVVIFSVVVVLELLVFGLSLATVVRSRRDKYAYDTESKWRLDRSKFRWVPSRSRDPRPYDMPMKPVYDERMKRATQDKVYDRNLPSRQRY